MGSDYYDDEPPDVRLPTSPPGASRSGGSRSGTGGGRRGASSTARGSARTGSKAASATARGTGGKGSRGSGSTTRSTGAGQISTARRPGGPKPGGKTGGRAGAKSAKVQPTRDPLVVLAAWLLRVVVMAWLLVASVAGAMVRHFSRHAQQVHPAHRRDGIGLAFLCLAIVCAVGIYTGFAGFYLVTSAVVGDGAFAIPILVALVGVRFLRHPDRNAVLPPAEIGWTALLVGGLGLFHIARGVPTLLHGGGGWPAIRTAGGLVGMAASWPIDKLLTAWAATPLLGALAAYGLLVITGTPLRQVPERIRGLFGRAAHDEWYYEVPVSQGSGLTPDDTRRPSEIRRASIRLKGSVESGEQRRPYDLPVFVPRADPSAAQMPEAGIGEDVRFTAEPVAPPPSEQRKPYDPQVLIPDAGQPTAQRPAARMPEARIGDDLLDDLGFTTQPDSASPANEQPAPKPDPVLKTDPVPEPAPASVAQPQPVPPPPVLPGEHLTLSGPAAGSGKPPPVPPRPGTPRHARTKAPTGGVDMFEIAIGSGAGGKFRVEVIRSQAGEASVSVELDVAGLAGRRRQIQQAVLASAAVTRRLLSADEQVLQDMGRELFAALLGTGPVLGLYRASQALAAQRGQRLRLVVRIDSPQLAGLPWESMYDGELGTYVCRSEQLVRHVPVAAVPAPLQVRPPLRVLGIISSPRGLPALDAEKEREQLEQALAEVVQAGLVQVHWARSATWAGLHEELMDGPWHVVHYIGHGDFDPDLDEGILALEREQDGLADRVAAHRAVDLLRQANPMPRLIMLNSCSGGAVGAHDLFSGTAASLVRGGVSAVAAMQYEISDPAAVKFARGFYARLGRGGGVDEAVSSGRISILGVSARTLEWVTPVLYLRGTDSRLFTSPVPPDPTASSDSGSRSALPALPVAAG